MAKRIFPMDLLEVLQPDLARQLTSPALQMGLSEHYPASFNGRVPRVIRPTCVLRSDFPLRTFPKHQDLVIQPSQTYLAWTNSHGAVAAILPDGRDLGVKPDEFEVVEWFPAELLDRASAAVNAPEEAPDA